MRKENKRYVFVIGGLLLLVAAVVIVEVFHQFWGFYLGLIGAAVGLIGARLFPIKPRL